jgi:hypothetical protein
VTAEAQAERSDILADLLHIRRVENREDNKQRENAAQKNRGIKRGQYKSRTRMTRTKQDGHTPYEVVTTEFQVSFTGEEPGILPR